MKPDHQKLIDALTEEIREAINDCMNDAVLYGFGFIRMTANGKVERITAKEALKHAEFIENNKVQ